MDLSHSWRSPWEAARASSRVCCTQTHTSAPSSLSHIGTNLPPGELCGQCRVSTVMGGWLPWGRTFSAFSLIGLSWLHIPPLLLNWSLCSITSTWARVDAPSPPPRQGCGEWIVTSLAPPGHLLPLVMQGGCVHCRAHGSLGGRPCRGNALVWALSQKPLLEGQQKGKLPSLPGGPRQCPLTGSL